MKLRPQTTAPAKSSSDVNKNDLSFTVLLAEKAMRDKGFITGAQMLHAKGGLYRYQGISLREADLSPEVLYTSGLGVMFHRPLDQFVGDEPRFTPYRQSRIQGIFDAYDVKEAGEER